MDSEFIGLAKNKSSERLNMCLMPLKSKDFHCPWWSGSWSLCLGKNLLLKDGKLNDSDLAWHAGMGNG